MDLTRTLPALLFALTCSAQAQEWELTTPIKRRSEVTGVVLHGLYEGFAIDEVMRNVIHTSDGGYTWDRRATFQSAPRALWMWDDQHGILSADGIYMYLTDDGFRTTTLVEQYVGTMTELYFVDDLLGFGVGESGKMIRTTDGGHSWSAMASGVTQELFNVQFVDAQNGFVAMGNGLLHTTDGGTTWTPIALPQDAYVRDIHFADADHGTAVGYGGLILRTSDAGANWTPVASPTTEYLLDIEAEGSVLLACGDRRTIIRSMDGGATWTQVASGLLLRTHNLTAINAMGAGLTGSDGDMYRTTDFGATWTLVQEGTAHTVLSKMSFANDTIGVCVGNAGMGGFEAGFLRTLDGGRHWRNLGGGGLGVHLRSDGVGVAGAARTSDFFTTTQPSIQAPSVAIRSVLAFTDQRYVIAGGYVNGGIYYTENGGANWSHPVSVSLSIFDVYFPTDQVGYACGEGGILYKTTDGGATWQELTSPVANDQFTVFFTDELHGWIGGASSGARTTDGGATWTSMPGIPPYTMSIFFTDAEHGYAVGNTGHVVYSADGGATWTNLVGAYFNALVGDAAWVDGALVAGGRFGDVYRVQLECPQALAPAPEVVRIGDELHSNAASGNQWYDQNGPIDGATASTFVPAGPGIYHVIVTDALGCPSHPSAPVDLTSTAVAEGPDAGQVRIAPNPAHDRFQLLGVTTTGRVDVLDLQGRSVLTGKAGAVVDVRALPAGVYLVRALVNGRMHVERLVKE